MTETKIEILQQKISKNRTTLTLLYVGIGQIIFVDKLSVDWKSPVFTASLDC